MKVSNIALALVFCLVSVTASACPKGTHLLGGEGPHHKGGKCVAIDDKVAEKGPDAKVKAKEEPKADAKEEKQSKKKEKSKEKSKDKK